jgi:hypothetical protein
VPTASCSFISAAHRCVALSHITGTMCHIKQHPQRSLDIVVDVHKSSTTLEIPKLRCGARCLARDRASTRLDQLHIVTAADTGSSSRHAGTMEPQWAGTTSCTMQLTESQDKKGLGFTHHWTIELVICVVEKPAWLSSNDVLRPLQITLLDCIAESR